MTRDPDDERAAWTVTAGTPRRTEPAHTRRFVLTVQAWYGGEGYDRFLELEEEAVTYARSLRWHHITWTRIDFVWC